MQETRLLKKGQMVHIGGIPFVLENDSELTTHESNWKLTFKEEEISIEEFNDLVAELIQTEIMHKKDDLVQYKHEIE